MTTINENFPRRLLMASIIAAMLLLGAFDSEAQENPTAPPKDYARPVNATDKFTFPEMGNVQGEPAKTEADVRALMSKAVKKQPPAQKTGPKARTRGSDARNQCGGGGYKGLCGMWQFDNNDFPSKGNTCGQAAAATMITHWQGLRSDAAFKKKLASFLYNSYGPNNALGLLGTSWQQVVNSITIPYKMSWRKVSGENDMRSELDKGIPVIVMIDSERLRQRGYGYKPSPVGISGHWVVVYGYDSGFYYVTNHDGNFIGRKDFLESWNTWIHGGFDGGNRGYVFWK